jgi:hypothetical protein
VAGLALEGDHYPADADDGHHDADIDSLGYQHDALLDMQFEKDADILPLGLGESRGISANPAKRVGQRLVPGTFSASIDGSSTPAKPRLPTQESPNSLCSSARKSTTSSGWRSTTPAFFSERAVSSAVITPAIPSKRPPEGTVSE